MPIYIVAPGDTLSSIAAENTLLPSRIIADNSLDEPDTLAVGQALLLRIPEREYTVKSGDTVFSIAQENGISPVTLYRNNPLLEGRDALAVGESLVISYRVEEEKTPLRLNGYSYPSIPEDLLTTTLPFLSYLTSFSYGFRSDGSLIVPDDQTLRQNATRYRVAPVLLLSTLREDGSFSSEKAETLLTDPALQQKIATSLKNETTSRSFTAVDVDFEFIDPALREQYAAFIALLHDTLSPAGVSTFVSLAPKYRADQPGRLYGAHDYALLSAAADRCLLMTYEWGYRNSMPMAVAPIDRVREVVDYALSEMSPEKIFLGFPNYGYDWPLPWVEGQTPARSLGNAEAMALAARYGAVIEYDERTRSPHFRYRAEDGIEHEVWFEDVRSINAKCDLVFEKGLAGVSIWNIMREYAGMFTMIDTRFDITSGLS